MAKVVAGMVISLDGYVQDRNGSIDALYPDLEGFVKSEPISASIYTTGAAVLGRRTYAMADDPDWYAGNYEYQVPLFVLTHTVPARHPKEMGDLTITFVTDGIESAIQQAKQAAGEKEVTIVGGTSVFQQTLQAGLVDELAIFIMPVLLGGGLRLFEDIGLDPLQLEKITLVDDSAGWTYLRYKVKKEVHNL